MVHFLFANFAFPLSFGNIIDNCIKKRFILYLAAIIGYTTHTNQYCLPPAVSIAVIASTMGSGLFPIPVKAPLNISTWLETNDILQPNPPTRSSVAPVSISVYGLMLQHPANIPTVLTMQILTALKLSMNTLSGLDKKLLSPSWKKHPLDKLKVEFK